MDSTLSRMWRHLRATIGVGRLFRVDDAGAVQLGQMRTGPNEQIEGVPIVRHYGLASNPPADTIAIAIFANGDRNSGVIVGTNHPSSRLKNLQPGEVAIFDDQGRWIFIKRNSIEIQAGGKAVDIKNATTITAQASTKVRLETPLLEVTGDITATNVTGSNDVVGGGKSLKTHVHSGVTAGGASTGVPV